MAEGALPKPKGPFSRENEVQEMTPKLLALAKVCLVLGNIGDILWHLLKRGSELETRWPISILDKNGMHKNKACPKSIEDNNFERGRNGSRHMYASAWSKYIAPGSIS